MDFKTRNKSRSSGSAAKRAPKMATLDMEQCQELAKLIEKLTTSGQQTLDLAALKETKKICKQSDEYVKEAYHIIMTQLEKAHAEIRLSASQLANELFLRSHCFRELLLADFKDFMELTLETDPEFPLPPPKATAKLLQKQTREAVHVWHGKFGRDYKKLSLGYHFLKHCKKINFRDAELQTVAERQREEERLIRVDAVKRERLKNTINEFNDGKLEIKDTLIQLENCLKLLLPDPESFTINNLLSPQPHQDTSHPLSGGQKTPARRSSKGGTPKRSKSRDVSLSSPNATPTDDKDLALRLKPDTADVHTNEKSSKRVDVKLEKEAADTTHSDTSHVRSPEGRTCDSDSHLSKTHDQPSCSSSLTSEGKIHPIFSVTSRESHVSDSQSSSKPCGNPGPSGKQLSSSQAKLSSEKSHSSSSVAQKSSKSSAESKSSSSSSKSSRSKTSSSKVKSKSSSSSLKLSLASSVKVSSSESSSTVSPKQSGSSVSLSSKSSDVSKSSSSKLKLEHSRSSSKKVSPSAEPSSSSKSSEKSSSSSSSSCLMSSKTEVISETGPDLSRIKVECLSPSAGSTLSLSESLLACPSRVSAHSSNTPPAASSSSKNHQSMTSMKSPVSRSVDTSDDKISASTAPETKSSVSATSGIKSSASPVNVKTEASTSLGIVAMEAEESDEEFHEISSGDEDESDDDDDDDDYDEAYHNQSQFVREHGFGSAAYNLQIEINPLAGDLDLQETPDNTDILATLHDLHSLVKNKHLSTVQRWIEVFTKTGADQGVMKKAIDLKQALEHARDKVGQLSIIRMSKRGTVQGDEDEDSGSGDEFEEVTEKEGYEPRIPDHLRAEYGLVEKQPQPSTSRDWEFTKPVLKSGEQDPATFASTIKKIKEQIDKGEISTAKPGSSRSAITMASASEKKTDVKLLEKAPVVAFGTDLLHWGEKMEAPMLLRIESEHRFWTPRENPEVVDQVAVDAMTSRVINFTGEFKPVKWKCRAPMANGKLCVRMDRVKCPFHGKIIARDNMGRPSNPEDVEAAIQKEVNREEGDDAWDDEDLQKEIEAATGIKLTREKGKKKKGGRKKYPGLTDLNAKNMARKRLEKKVLSRSAMKRVAATLDGIQRKRYRDKFGNQFNYSMNTTV